MREYFLGVLEGRQRQGKDAFAKYVPFRSNQVRYTEDFTSIEGPES